MTKTQAYLCVSSCFLESNSCRQTKQLCFSLVSGCARNLCAAMARADAVRVVADAPALAAAATEWLTHADRRARWAANASAFVRANQGALGRTMAALADSGLLRPVSRDARHP